MLKAYITRWNYQRLLSKLTNEFKEPRFHFYKDCKWLNKNTSGIMVIKIDNSITKNKYVVSEVSIEDLPQTNIENQIMDTELMKQIDNGFKINDDQIFVCPECFGKKFPRWIYFKEIEDRKELERHMLQEAIALARKKLRLD